MDLGIGDLVCIKSGSQPLLVVDLDGSAACVVAWRDCAGVQEAVLPQACLTRLKPGHEPPSS